MDIQVRIIHSPFTDSFAIAGGLVLQGHVPYSVPEQFVTIKLNPNVTQYEAKPKANVRQLTKSEDTDQTREIKFDFKDNTEHEYESDGKKYKIRLLDISEKVTQGVKCPCFEFMVSFEE